MRNVSDMTETIEAGALKEAGISKFRRFMAATLIGAASFTSGAVAQPTPTTQPVAEVSSDENAARDYTAILTRFDQIVGRMLFDPRILSEQRWIDFRTQFGALASDVQTDAEFVAAFNTALADADLFSHFSLHIDGTGAEEPSDQDGATTETTPLARFENLGDGVGLIRIRSFMGEGLLALINQVFDQAIESEVSTLVVDLRGNPGGNFQAWPVGTRLTREPLPIGLLVAGQWFASHSGPPTLEEIASATPMTVPDGPTLVADLMDDGLSVFVGLPQEPTYQGRVFVLIDGETGSTSEIVAAALQRGGVAQLVGQRSAGRVLNANMMPLADGLSLKLPIADFMLPDGGRLERIGVVPDFPTNSDNALECAIAISRGAGACLTETPEPAAAE